MLAIRKPVTYTVEGFLEKNKDVMQDSLFEAMRASPNKFVRDIPRFQNMLDDDRRVLMAKRLKRKESTAGATNKTKPTVGDTFRRQLTALVEVLDDTTPWWAHLCLFPTFF